MRNIKLLKGVKRALAIVLTSSVLATLAPNCVGGVLKVEASYYTNWYGLGVSDIINPSGAGTWNYVYLGKYKIGDKYLDMKWRVLDKNAARYTSGKSMLLDCDNILADYNYSSRDNTDTYEWSRSDSIRPSLNGYFPNSFTSVELSYIMPTTISQASSQGYKSTVDMAVNGDRFFILGANDVNNLNYGYSDNDSRKKYRLGTTNYFDWWLRTRSSTINTSGYTDLQIIGNDGSFKPFVKQSFYEPYNDSGNHGVSPAFNLDPSGVVFTRLDIGDKGKASATYALVLKDPSIKLSISDTKGVVKQGNTISVPVSAIGLADNSQICYFVSKGEYVVGNANNAELRYMDKVTSFSDGVVTFTLPEIGKDDHIYLTAINPQGSADRFTDYASEPVEITHIHNYELSASGATATIKCAESGCPDGNTSYTATITASGKDYDGKAVAEAKINKSANFPTSATVSAITYKGTAGTTYNSTSAPVDRGQYTASATVTYGSGSKTIEADFEIGAKILSAKMITVNPNSYEYDGKEKAPTVTVKDGGTILIEDKDYVVYGYVKATKAGSYELTVAGKGNYTGSTPVEWKITEKKDNSGKDNNGNNNSGNNNNNSGNNNNGGNNNSGNNNNGGNNTGNNNNNSGNSNTGNNSGNNNANNNAGTPVAKGQPVESSTANFVVVSSDAKNPTVQYKSAKNNKATTINVPNTVKFNGVTYKITEVGAKAFYNNKKAKKVKIGKYVTKIGNSAFAGCKNLETVTGGAAVKTIGANAYNGCIKLKKAPIGAKVTSIGEKAFYNCNNMTTMVIPVNVNKLGKQFAGKTPKMKTVTVKTKKLTKKNVNAKAYTGMGSKNTVTTVPKGMGKTYKTLFQNKGMNKKIKIKQSKK